MAETENPTAEFDIAGQHVASARSAMLVLIQRHVPRHFREAVTMSVDRYAKTYGRLTAAGIEFSLKSGLTALTEGMGSTSNAEQLKARRSEEAAEQVLADVIASMKLQPFQSASLETAAASYAKARSARLHAERERGM